MQKIQHALRDYLAKNNITIYRLVKQTGIRYELLRRSINGNRVLTADELVLILTKTPINLEDLIKQDTVC